MVFLWFSTWSWNEVCSTSKASATSRCRSQPWGFVGNSNRIVGGDSVCLWSSHPSPTGILTMGAWITISGCQWIDHGIKCIKMYKFQLLTGMRTITTTLSSRRLWWRVSKIWPWMTMVHIRFPRAKQALLPLAESWSCMLASLLRSTLPQLDGTRTLQCSVQPF